jgi:hypothetical protein
MKTLLFDFDVIKSDLSTYTPIDTTRNMYIFEYNRKTYAYNKCTCMFYQLKKNEYLKCYYIIKTLNHYRPLVIKIWKWTFDKKTRVQKGCNEYVIMDYSTYSCTSDK